MTSLTDSHPLADDEALRRRLVALARHWLIHGDEAEDLVHDTWLRTADSLPPAATSREAWLVTVLRHLCIDGWRRQSRYHTILEQLAGDDTLPSRSDDPERLLEQARRVALALSHVVRTLSASDVAVVLLYEVFDFSHAELGILVGRSEAASRQQVRRMMQRLRHTEWVDVPPDEDSIYLLALCQLAIARRDSAILVAVLRAARPQALASFAHASAYERADAAPSPKTQLVQSGNSLALMIHADDGSIMCLPLGEAYVEDALA